MAIGAKENDRRTEGHTQTKVPARCDLLDPVSWFPSLQFCRTGAMIKQADIVLYKAEVEEVLKAAGFKQCR